MVTELPKKDYIMTKIILAIGLIPFSFYMLQENILRGSLLDALVGINLLALIFSVMIFFLTIALLFLSLSFTQIDDNNKKIFFGLFNNFFDMGVFFTVGLFAIVLISILAEIIKNNWSKGILNFIDQNFTLIISFALIAIIVITYSKYYKKIEGGK